MLLLFERVLRPKIPGVRRPGRRGFLGGFGFGARGAIGGGVTVAGSALAAGSMARDVDSLQLGERTDPVRESSARYGSTFRGFGLIATAHGVVPNAPVDQSSRFQELLDRLAGNGGGALFVPAGVYRVDAPLFIRGNGVQLIGEGIDATSLVSGVRSPDRDLVVIGDFERRFRISGCGVRALSLYGDPRVARVADVDERWRRCGVLVEYSSNCVLEDVRVDHFAQAGILLDRVVHVDGPDETSIVRCRASVNGIGIHVRGGHSTKIVGGLIDFSDSVGLRIEDRNSVYVSGMDIEQNRRQGVEIVGGAHDISVRECTFENNGRALPVNSREKVHLWVGSGRLVTGVRVRDCFFQARYMRHLIRVDHVLGCVIDGNFVESANQFARRDSPVGLGGASFVLFGEGSSGKDVKTGGFYFDKAPNAFIGSGGGWEATVDLRAGTAGVGPHRLTGAWGDGVRLPRGSSGAFSLTVRVVREQGSSLLGVARFSGEFAAFEEGVVGRAELEVVDRSNRGAFQLRLEVVRDCVSEQLEVHVTGADAAVVWFVRGKVDVFDM